MARQLKNTLIFLLSGLMFAFMGMFFVGCGTDVSNISISSDVDTVNLEVGDSETITFTIENYSSSFSNKVQVNPYFDGTTTLFSVSDVEYLSDDVFSVTVTALAGGNGTLQIVSLQGAKECSVPVSVTQYSSSLSFNDDLLYVSDSTDFVPTHGNFTFDANTTEKDMTYYCFDANESSGTSLDLSGYSFSQMTENDSSFSVTFVDDKTGSSIVKTVYQFDTISLDNGVVRLSLDGSDLGCEFSDVSTLLVLAIYNGKTETEAADAVWDLGTVYVLPDLDVSITGGYLVTLPSSTLSLDEDLTTSSSLIISPNYSQMNQYIIRIERENVSADTEIVTDFSVSDETLINVQYLSTDEVSELYSINANLASQDSGKNVEYLRVLSSTQMQVEVSLSISCRYAVAASVTDESVNVQANLAVDVKIAPTSILVNGSESFETLTLYYNYSAPDFGWNDLAFEVISNYASDPNINGIYFTYSDNLELTTQDNVSVRQGATYVYSYFDTTFKVRGYGSTSEVSDSATITVHVSCDWGDFSALTFDVNFVVLSGVTKVSFSDETYSTIYLDVDDGTQQFYVNDADGVVGLYADDYFQSLSFELVSGSDVVTFSYDESTVCLQVDDNYYLNFSITPTATGSGIYRVYTDNGTQVTYKNDADKPLYLTVTCLNSLQDATISLVSGENENVTYYKYSDCEEDGTISKSLYVEVQNTNVNGVLQTGKTVSLQVEGSYTPISSTSLISTNIEYDEDVAAFSSISTSGTTFSLSTLANGNATITVEIEGYQVSRFSRSEVSLIGYVHLSAYSLLDTFYLKNGEDYALSNSIYYGPDETKTVTFTPYVESESASNFYMYKFTDAALTAMFETAVNASGSTANFEIKSSNFDEYINKELVTESYDSKFIYFYANTSSGTSWGNSSIDLTFKYMDGAITKTVTVTVSISSGLMFYVELAPSYTFTIVQYDKNIPYTNVTISTYNIYQVYGIGTFDMNTFSYTQTTSIGENEIVMAAYLEQRNGTPNDYHAHIYVQNYQYAETITLVSSTTDIYFSSVNLTKTINVSVYPSTATNSQIHIEYVATNSKYSNLIEWSVTDNGNGNYQIDLSCQSFYSSTTNIQTIEDALSGTLYIYPSDWGSSHSELGYLQTINGVETEVSVQPIEISINFQNGSLSNPYLLSSSEDVLNIGLDSSMLASHYVITSKIDMTGVVGTPIGILNGEVVGFSGTITGTTSQAAIVNLDVSNWTATVGGVTYCGLFAQINSAGSITNVSFSGCVNNLSLSSGTAYVSLLAAANFGTLTSVGVEVNAVSDLVGSSISVADGATLTLYFGAVAALNYGTIVQDFTMFETEHYVLAEVFDSDVTYYQLVNGSYEEVSISDSDFVANTYYQLSTAEYAGLQTKILTYFNATLTISGGGSGTIIYAGGIVGANAGLLQRIESDTLTMYGMARYSSYALISVTGEAGTAYIGAAVGVASGVDTSENPTYNLVIPEAQTYYTITVNSKTYGASVIDNLLVGGEISTLSATIGTDAIGGVVGYACAGGNFNGRIYYVYVTNCTSRTFVRGHVYVGAIIGLDYLDNNIGQESYLDYSSNTIQAVDDGRYGIWASMIIKLKTSIPSDVESNLEIYASIGSAAIVRGFTYYPTFSATSYLSRDEASLTASLSTTDNTIYYGDLLILTKATGATDVTTIDTSSSSAYCLATGSASVSTDDTTDSNVFKMSSDEGSDLVYYMTYFSVTGDLSGETGSAAQESIQNLNIFAPGSALYPFTITEKDVTIKSSSSDYLSIDSSGRITLKKTGLATINVTSLLNQNKTLVIYIYIVDFFDATITSSMFHSGTSVSSAQVSESHTQYVYGNNSYESIYAVPSYAYSDVDVDGNEVLITEDGLLQYKNVWYYLSTSNAVEVAVTLTGTTETATTSATTASVTGKTITFHKASGATDGAKDSYNLTPYISQTVNGKLYRREFTDAAADISVVYCDAATQILTEKTYISFQTSQTFSTSVSVISSRDSENLFYEIYKDEELVQWRLPLSVSSLGTDNILDYLNLTDDEYYSDTTYSNAQAEMENLSSVSDLFTIEFSRSGNTYTLTCKVNKNSTAYTTDYDNIFGVYEFVFYSSELTGGVSCTMRVELLKPELSYVAVSNYSNINSMSREDETVVPTQRGVLEITIDPLDAVFDTITISNNSTNSASAYFTLAVEVVTKTGALEFYVQQGFGTQNLDGSYSFTYEALLELLDAITEADNGYTAVEYYGRFYVSYMMPSNGLEDGEKVGFDIEVTYGSDLSYETSIFMNVELANYARLVFDDKEISGEYYYLARGLSYSLTLDLYNFTSDEVTFSISNNTLGYVTLTEDNGTYTLTVTSGNIGYTAGQDGYLIEITTTATKEINGEVRVKTEDVLKICIMEFVFEYSYASGTNEDVVSGMEDGVISIAVGNPLDLELDIFNFIEYQSSIADVVTAVNTFVSDLTNITWKVVENDVETVLSSGKVISSNYYSISSYTVTPTKIYDWEDGIYYFTVFGRYKIGGGTYTFTSETSGTSVLYTEFSLDVRNQSAQDNPIPIYTYEELCEMEDGEWYILMANITLPSDQMATTQEIDAFSPISTAIAGLDGNGYTIYYGSTYGSTYTFTDLTAVGLFSEVSEDTILSNITISLYDDITFVMNTATFQIGLLAAENNGTITNCETKMRQSGNYDLTVNCSVSTSSSYVAGLVASNSGYITNSRSSVNIFSTDNLSGFVGTNSGHIASSYYRGGSLTNTTNTTSELTAGFVIENSGDIYACYVSGDSTDNASSQYYAESDNVIKSTANSAGFVYTNTENGTVSDSYSNIYMTASQYHVAGFVFANQGTISRCISWSVLESNQSSCYGFAYSNAVSNSENGIYDCFYLCEPGDSEQNIPSINVSISKLPTDEQTQITALDLEGFADVDNFSSFSISSGRSISSVWFFNTSKTSLTNFNGKLFNTNRVELVAANIVAKSVREIESTTNKVDAETGATYVVYNYAYSSSSYTLGSMYNPILITSADDFESYIVQKDPTINNYYYYRIVCDIDFSDASSNCGTYVTKFMGYLEGNYMTLSSVSLASSDSTTSYAGLFAEVGSSTNSKAIGTVMNLTLSASQIYFPSTNVVGGIVGKLDGGTLVNLTVTGAESVVGANIVGGVVGAAIGEYTIYNVYSTTSVVARNLDTSDGNDFSSSYVDNSAYSFAGAIAGVLSGSGSVYGVTIDSEISVLADKAGLVFGFVDSGVTVTSLTLENQAENSINAYSYAGLVVGETKGNFVDVEIVGFGDVFEGFDMSLYVPDAIGTFAGLMSGGSLTNISSDQSVSTSSISTGSASSSMGLVGLVNSSVSISGVTIGSSEEAVELTGYENVGAIIGSATAASGTISVDVSDFEIYAQLSSLGIRQTCIGVGGVVGYVGSGTSVNVSGTEDVASTIEVEIVVTSTSYGSSTALTVGAGAVMGYNVSNSAHSAEYVNAEMAIDVSVSLLSGNESVETQTATLTATTNTSALTEIALDTADTMVVNQIGSTKTYTTGKISYSRTENCSVALQVNIFGVFS